MAIVRAPRNPLPCPVTDPLRALAARADPALRATLLAIDTTAADWRLHAGTVLQAAGDPETARTLLRAHVAALPRPDEAVRDQRALLAQLAVRLGEVGVLERYLRACYGQAVEVRLDGPEGPQRSGVVDWALSAERCTFTFSTGIVRHGWLNTVVKHWAWSLPLLLGYRRAHPAVEGAVNLNLEDMGQRPGLGFCDNRPDYFLLPDPVFVGTHGYRGARAALDQCPPWADRAPLAYWRGSTTGWTGLSGKPITSWRELPRAVLCTLGRDSPAAGLCDFAFSNIAQLPAATGDEINAEGLLRPYDPLGTLANYRYQIDIDGNTNAWPGLFAKLYSGSPVLKVGSSQNFRQWYYDRLKPWANYIPVHADMSDLADKLTWLVANPAIAEAIGRNGHALAKSMTLTHELANATPTIATALIHAMFARR